MQEPFPFLIGIGLWVVVIFSFFLSSHFSHSQKKEFYVWFGILVISLFLGLMARDFSISLASWVFSGILSWILAIRFYYFFSVGWLVLTGYLFCQFQELLLSQVSLTLCLIVGNVLWIYGGIKAVSGRTIPQVSQGWLLGQLGFFIFVIIKKENFNLFYEVTALGALGGLLASILAQAVQRFDSIFLSEWGGRRDKKKEIVFGMSGVGLAAAYLWGGFVFWQSFGFVIGITFLLGWLFLILSYWRVGQHLFVKQSLQLESA